MNEFAALVRQRANGRCEYCLLPQSAGQSSFHVEHILARQHGGTSTPDNLAWACVRCNLKKGPNLAGIDPASGKLTPLFNPRTDRWSDHFKVANRERAIVIRGRTPIGRTTVQLLAFNEETRSAVRSELWS